MISRKSLEQSGLLIKGINETVQNEAKEQKGEFLSILLGTLGASLLGNLLTSKGVNQQNPSNIPGAGVMRAGESTTTAGENF